jgi:alpha-amylase/alpha-mannosidase (GH57 family)
MTNGFVAIHGHFYQPPRENPWLETIEAEESARPFHDWNERIAFECYRPNAYARILDEMGKILEIINNYSFMSFNFGPTLLQWIQEKLPRIYRRILEADQEGLGRFGHGSAMAQVYNHIIMPLANERDRETEVRWGIADFEKRFGRRPYAMWLPETAVNYATLRSLVKHGMEYLILSPFQASRVRPFGGKRWTDVSGGQIDPTHPYRCLMKDEAGKKLLDQFIDIFFYDGSISREVSFGDLVTDGRRFSQRFGQAYQSSKRRPQLIHIATDGETYGHHKKFGDLTLAYALHGGFHSQGLEVINHRAFLKRFPPVYEVEIDEGPNGEGTSWSCVHGVGRWKEDCGCSTGGRPGWNQKWRKPLREAFDALRDELSEIFEGEGRSIFKDPWEARNGYIDVVMDRSPATLDRFFRRYGAEDLSGRERIRGLKLLEMQRHALQMYTSCGWFFSDLSGLETIIVLQHAAKALEMAEEAAGREMEGKFVKILSRAESNLPEMGSGDQVYERLVKSRRITLDQIVHQYAISSLFRGEENRKVFAYRVEKMDYERVEKDRQLLIMGRVRITPDLIPDSKEFAFGMIRSKKDAFRTWVLEEKGELDWDRVKESLRGSFGGDEEETARRLTSVLGTRVLTIRDVLREKKQAVLRKLIEEEMEEYLRCFGELFDNTKEAVGVLAREGLEIPFEIRVAAEAALSRRLLHEAEHLKSDFKSTVEGEAIDRIIGEARRHGYQLRMEEPTLILNGLLKERMEVLRDAMARPPTTSPEDDRMKREKVGEVIKLLDLAHQWGIKLQIEEAQDSIHEMLKEYVGGLEESWWREGAEKSFPPNLIQLAERLNFNVKSFLQMMNRSFEMVQSP